MAVYRIPVNKLSSGALHGVIDEFISISVTDYGEVEAYRETKFRQVKSKLTAREAVLIFDDETETTYLFLADDPISKGLIHYPDKTK